MKNKLLFLACFVVLISCKEEEPFFEPRASTPIKTIGNVDILESIKKDLMLLQYEEGFKNILYDLAEVEQFGEPTVIIDYLKMAREEYMVSSSKFRVSDSAFDSLLFYENEQLYPQVYIPFYSELKETGKIGISEPTIVVYNGDESNQVYYGDISSGSNGRVSRVLVTEDFAQENEVWVVSYNEDLFDPIQRVMLPDECEVFGVCGGSGGDSEPVDTTPIKKWCPSDGVDDGSSPIPEGINIYLQKLKVSCHKEPWISGKSEVRLVMTSDNCTGSSLQNWKIYLYPETINGVKYLDSRKDLTAYKEYGVKRGDIKDENELIKNENLTELDYAYYNCPSYMQGRYCQADYLTTVGWGFSDGNITDTRGDHIYFVIYERDAGIGSWRSETFSVCDNSLSLDYFSQDDKYASGFVNNIKPLDNNKRNYGDYPCKTFTTSCIEFNFYTKAHEPNKRFQ